MSREARDTVPVIIIVEITSCRAHNLYVSNRESFQAPPRLNTENVLKIDIWSCLLFAIVNAMFRQAAASQTHRGSVGLDLKVHSMT